nr:RNA-directed DNA polymerase, eukaryota [Tanacetum cinerariifolium]
SSYANVVSGFGVSIGDSVDKSPAMILDDECLVSSEFSNSLFGRVKEFASLANIKITLANEGFADISIQYLGGYWILGVFFSVDDQEDLCFHSKRLCVHTTNPRSISEEFNIIFCGKVYWIRAKETSGWVPDFADAYGDKDSDAAISNDEGDKNQNSNIFGDDDDAEDGREHQVNEDPIEEGEVMINEEASDDPFKIYHILNDKTKNMAGKGSSSSYTHPPGFSNMKGQEDKQGMENNNTQGKEDATGLNKNGNESVQPKHIEEVSDSVFSGRFKKSEAKKEWVKELCNMNKVNFLSLQETKMEVMDILCVKLCWGNIAFEYVHSDAVGNSGGILCVWDHICYYKENVMKFDSFVIIRGVWRATGVKLMIIVVYAPHEQKEKHLLWDYLERDIKRYLSDHCPIFLREISHDYGPIPFKDFHYWFDIDGFNNLVEGIWKGYQSKELNPIRFFIGKLKVLKRKIREWNNSRRSADISLFLKLKLDLESIDEIIDRRDGTEEIMCKCSGIINNLNDLSNIQTMEVTQKTKIRWAIEGDENSSFFNGMLNKKRRTLNVHGVLVDGSWIDNPIDVKDEFFNHFST